MKYFQFSTKHSNPKYFCWNHLEEAAVCNRKVYHGQCCHAPTARTGKANMFFTQKPFYFQPFFTPKVVLMGKQCNALFKNYLANTRSSKSAQIYYLVTTFNSAFLIKFLLSMTATHIRDLCKSHLWIPIPHFPWVSLHIKGIHDKNHIWNCFAFPDCCFFSSLRWGKYRYSLLAPFDSTTTGEYEKPNYTGIVGISHFCCYH